MEVVVHSKGKSEDNKKNFKVNFFQSAVFKVIFNPPASYTKSLRLFSGWNGNLEIKKPIKTSLYKGWWSGRVGRALFWELEILP